MNDKNKMEKFISHLRSNPCFKKETPLKIEEQIQVFFTTNQKALKPTFSSPDYFPGLSWEEAQKLFYITLREMTNATIEPIIQNIILRKIDYSFMNVLNTRKRSNEEYGNQLLSFISDLIKIETVRSNIDAILKIVAFKFPEKYIEEIYSKRSYIVFELEKVQKLNFNALQIANYVKLVLFLHLISYSMKLEKDNSSQISSSLFITKQQTEKLLNQAKSKLSLFPESVLLSGIKVNMSFREDNMLEATSRLSRIFYELGKSYTPNIKVARGAENFEKSWFQIQRKNFSYFGFDKKMIEELYRISAENYW